METATMHTNQQQKNPDYLLGTINALRAQVQQINTTIATLEERIQAKPDVERTPNMDVEVRSQGYELLRQAFPARNLTEAFVSIFKNFAELEPTFPARFKKALKAELAKAKKPSKRGYIAATPQDLYPGNPKLWKFAQEIAPGWMLGTNESSEKKLRFIRLACKVIDLRWGKELKVSFR
jgi:hypothetical protein